MRHITPSSQVNQRAELATAPAKGCSQPRMLGIISARAANAVLWRWLRRLLCMVPPSESAMPQCLLKWQATDEHQTPLMGKYRAGSHTH